MVGFLAGIAYLMSVTHLLGQQVCKPNLAFKEVHFSEMQPPTLKRTWGPLSYPSIQPVVRRIPEGTLRSFSPG
jgi:hypothetical protein